MSHLLIIGIRHNHVLAHFDRKVEQILGRAQLEIDLADQLLAIMAVTIANHHPFSGAVLDEHQGSLKIKGTI